MIAVVVPARDAAATLPRALAAIAAQDAEHALIVVDDGSADATGELARAAGATVLRLEGAGPGAARDAGAAAAPPGAPLAFTDADCYPAPGWLAAGRRALEAADLVQGRVEPDPRAAAGPYDRTVRVGGLSPLFETANLFVGRAAFDAAGGFGDGIAAGPEAFAGARVAAKHLGEDVAFGWRVRRGGGRVAYAPEALVHHHVFARGPREYVAERRRVRHFPSLVAQTPELREAFLWRRWFLTRRSAAFDLALLGAAAAAAHRSPWPLAAALPYARLARRGPAAEVLADAAAAAALARGSLAARTLVL